MTSHPRRAIHGLPTTHAAGVVEPRQAGRGTVITATFLAVMIAFMFAVNTPLSFLAGTAIFVAVHNYDRKVRPEQTAVPLIAYVLGIYALAVVTIIVACIVLLAMLAILP